MPSGRCPFAHPASVVCEFLQASRARVSPVETLAKGVAARLSRRSERGPLRSRDNVEIVGVLSYRRIRALHST
jgi:hypothetical protein